MQQNRILAVNTQGNITTDIDAICKKFSYSSAKSISCDAFKNKWRILARFARSKGSYAGCQIIGFLGVSGDSVKIADITAENKTVNFIARIVSAFEIKEFTRDDGTIGRVGNLIVGDETGKIRVTLWDNIADLIKTMKSDLLKFIRASLLR